MAKKTTIKDNMKQGLGAFFNPEPVAETTKQEKPTTQERRVSSNYQIPESQHRKLKLFAVERGMTLKEVIEEALGEYIEKHAK